MQAKPISLAQVAGLCAALLAAAPALAQDKVWRHAVIEPKGDAGFTLMVQGGGFAAKRGLKLEVVSMKNGAIAHKALLAGEVESIESSPGAAILAGARGADIKILGCDWPGVPQGILARGSIAKIEDLKGKTVAVAAPGSLPNLVIAAVLDKYKIPQAEVHLAPMGDDADRFKALVNGAVDAGVIAAEFLSVAPPEIKLLAETHDVMPNYIRLCLTMTGATLKARHDEAVRFVAAEIEALRFAVSHPQETIKLTRDTIHTKPDDPRAKYAFDYTVKNHLVDPEVSLPLDKLQWMQNQLVELGDLKKPIDIAKLTAPDARAEAMKLAGAK
jgi:NitT/TauT family transport system substrate-binding protein